MAPAMASKTAAESRQADHWADAPREERRVSRRLAFLVDGDNTSPGYIGEMLAEASKYGSLVVRRIYGDWGSTRMNGWRSVLREHALVPVQQIANVAGKNATDIGLVIDAMDELHGQVVDGFCLVTSDSDFTRLATRIREEGLFVMGIGAEKTPEALRRACEVFVYLENLAGARGLDEDSGPAKRGSRGSRGGRGSRPSRKGRETLARAGGRPRKDAIPLLRRALDNVAREDGWGTMSGVGNAVLKLDPAFDPRTYGHSKLLDLIEDLEDDFEIRHGEGSQSRIIFVRRLSKTKHPSSRRSTRRR